MPRARNKDDLVKFSSENYSKLIEMISRMTENQLNTPFDFSDDKSKKEFLIGDSKIIMNFKMVAAGP